jgi:hypothetical protein
VKINRTEQAVKYLRRWGVSNTSQMATAFGLTLNGTRNLMRRMHKAGLVVRTQRGKGGDEYGVSYWALKESQPTGAEE